MKSKLAALYDPYLNTLGGGEKHLLSILQVLEQRNYKIHIYWDEKLTQAFQEKLNITFQTAPVFKENIFQEHVSAIEKLKILSQYDILIYATDGSYFFSTAHHTYIFAMIPNRALYTTSLLNKAKLLNARFITNSRYTQGKLQEWNISSQVLYPYLDRDILKKHTTPKEHIILNVGRFFPQLHSKRQDVAIRAFQKLVQSQKYADFTLILAGGLLKEDQEYYESLQTLTQGDKRIIFMPNITHDELIKLYRRSLIYWHCAGYGVDTKIHPENVEHLGITPLEAMASGCITFCYNAGGPQETIVDGETGFLYNSIDELIEKTEYVLKIKTANEIRTNAHEFVSRAFSYEAFTQQVNAIIA
ncbi:glycosyltransferase family 4 protein [Candidatus Roizmanbacteria bacterium]|nr:glycosyltransferase family 4 protein [Candidatus Roizmanbacteria bacterium]